MMGMARARVDTDAPPTILNNSTPHSSDQCATFQNPFVFLIIFHNHPEHVLAVLFYCLDNPVWSEKFLHDA